MSFDELMQTLRAEYLQSLPQKVEIIQQLCKQGDLELLREEFHKLKGTGKTYGIPEITELCAVVEQLCVDKSPKAVDACKLANQLLSDIHAARSNGAILSLAQDPHFVKIQSFAA